MSSRRHVLQNKSLRVHYYRQINVLLTVRYIRKSAFLRGNSFNLRDCRMPLLSGSLRLQRGAS